MTGFTDQSSLARMESTSPPSLLVSVLTRIGSHLFTLAAGAMAADGMIPQDQQTQLVSIGLAVLTWAAGYAWNEAMAYVHRKNADARVAQAKVSQ